MEGENNHKVYVNEFDDMFGMIYHTTGPKIMDTLTQDAINQEHDDSTISKYGDFEGEPSKLPNLGKEVSKFFKLLEYAQQKLYPKCENFTKSSFIVKLLQIKCLFGLSDKTINSLMQLFKQALSTP